MQRKGVLDDDGLLGLQIGIHETGDGVFHLFFFSLFFFCSWEHSLSKAVLVVTIHILGKSIVMRSCANVVG